MSATMLPKVHKLRGVALSAAVLLALLAPASARANPCADVFDRLYPDTAQPLVRYVQGEAGNDITYGLEGELSVQKAPGLLDWYRPNNKTDEQWFAMSLEERKAAASSPWGMVKTSRAPEWLHERLSSDPGGAEFMTRPTDKLEEAMGWVNTVEQQLGQDQHGRSRVYWQGNVAYKRDGAFSRDNRAGIMGYVKAAADYAQFGKLHKGYETHQSNPEFVPGKNLGHSVLGPMNSDKVAETEQELQAACENRSSNRSSHYMQGTYFRTWCYGPDRNGFEVRDAHKDVPVLRREMKRITHGLQQGFAAFGAFKDLTMTDESGHFAQFSEPVRRMLSNINYSYGKRYALPMRPFENEYPQALGLQGAQAETFRNQIINARNEYVRTLESLAANYQQNSPDREQITNQVRIALGKFAHQSGIYTALDDHFARIGQP
jgi:hypothetical protein